MLRVLDEEGHCFKCIIIYMSSLRSRKEPLLVKYKPLKMRTKYYFSG